MTQIELIGKIKAEIERLRDKATTYIKDRPDRDQFGIGVRTGLNDIGNFIESLEKEQLQEQTIKGWVARDGDMGHLRLYPNKPWRGMFDYEWGSGYPAMQFLDDTILPDVTFENSPIEVELTIRKV